MEEFEAEKPVFNFFSKCTKLALSSPKEKKNKPQTSLSKNVRNSPKTRKMPWKYVAFKSGFHPRFLLASKRVVPPLHWHHQTPPAANPVTPKRCPREPGWLSRGHIPLVCMPTLRFQAQGLLSQATSEQVKSRYVHFSGCTPCRVYFAGRGCNTQSCTYPPSTALVARPMNHKTAWAAGDAARRDQFLTKTA